MEEHAENIKRVRSGSSVSAAARVPLPASRGNSMYSVQDGVGSPKMGRGGGAGMVEAIQEREEMKIEAKQEESQPKVSFELPYLR